MWVTIFLGKLDYFFLLVIDTPDGMTPREPLIQLQTIKAYSAFRDTIKSKGTSFLE